MIQLMVPLTKVLGEWFADLDGDGLATHWLCLKAAAREHVETYIAMTAMAMVHSTGL